MEFSINDDFSGKCDQICRKLRIWSYVLKKSLMRNFKFCAGYVENRHRLAKYVLHSMKVELTLALWRSQSYQWTSFYMIGTSAKRQTLSVPDMLNTSQKCFKVFKLHLTVMWPLFIFMLTTMRNDVQYFVPHIRHSMLKNVEKNEQEKNDKSNDKGLYVLMSFFFITLLLQVIINFINEGMGVNRERLWSQLPQYVLC